MTYTTRKIKAAATLFVLTTTTLCINAPASAGTQADVQSCRAAMTSHSNIDMSAYRLRFERKKGYRKQTLYLKAIPKKGGESFRFTCHFNRRSVVALNGVQDTIKFAKLNSNN